MITSQQTAILSEIQETPIPTSVLTYFRDRLKDRLHALILGAFLKQSEENKLTQKELAERIGRDKAQINRWLSTASNWTLDTISDLMVGMRIDLDDPSFTTFVELARQLAVPSEAAISTPVETDVSRVRALFRTTPLPEDEPYARNAAARVFPDPFQQRKVA